MKEPKIVPKELLSVNENELQKTVLKARKNKVDFEFIFLKSLH